MKTRRTSAVRQAILTTMSSNYLEYMYGTDPTKEDTDNDGEIDSFEVAFGRNPNGEGMLALGASQKDLIKDYIASSEKLSDFTEEKVLGEIQEMFNPDQQVALDLPQDREIILTKQNRSEERRV